MIAKLADIEREQSTLTHWLKLYHTVANGRIMGVNTRNTLIVNGDLKPAKSFVRARHKTPPAADLQNGQHMGSSAAQYRGAIPSGSQRRMVGRTFRDAAHSLHMSARQPE